MLLAIKITNMNRLCKHFDVSSIIGTLESDNYKTLVQHTTMYGPYDWCCNFERSGYYLTNSDKTPTHTQKGNNQMLQCSIVMSNKLFRDIDTIEMYDATGFLAQYSLDLRYPFYNFFFMLKYVDTKEAPTDMKIKYSKILPKPSENFLGRGPMKTIHEETITIPTLTTKGADECPICLDNVEVMDDCYISQCQHIFHNKCIFEYIESIGCIKDAPAKCDYCEHTTIIEPFKCPVCSVMLEDN